jgi:HSP20 family protein
MYRRMRMPTLWREMDQLQREMNRLMESSLRPGSFSPAGFPAVNIWASEDRQVVTAELPGLKASDIDINITADQLVLTGTRTKEEIKGETQLHRNERSFGKFTRSIQLPFMVDTNQVEATIKDGILEISLVRAESDKPRKISVKTA